METKENVENMKKCSLFDKCDCAICPLDNLATERNSLAEDKKCHFISQEKFNRKKITDNLLKFVPKKNYKLLNTRSKNKIGRLAGNN